MIGLPADYYPIETALELSGPVTLPDVQAVLSATDIRQHLSQEAPGAELIAMQFSGMRKVPGVGGGPLIA